MEPCLVPQRRLQSGWPPALIINKDAETSPQRTRRRTKANQRGPNHRGHGGQRKKPGKRLKNVPSYAVTSVPTFSPCTTRLMLPCSPSLKTTIGSLLSFESEMEVVSITFRPFWMTSK